MKIVLSPRALMNLDDISSYLNPRSQLGARHVASAIARAFKVLELYPRSGRKQIRSQVRKSVVKKYPYVIYYTVLDDTEEIYVLAVRHTSRRRPFKNL